MGINSFPRVQHRRRRDHHRRHVLLPAPVALRHQAVRPSPPLASEPFVTSACYRTDKLIDVMIVYCVNTGLLTTCVSFTV